MSKSRILGNVILGTGGGSGGGAGGVPDDGSVTTPKLADNAVTSQKIADGTIVDGDISSTAAIALSKLAVDPRARATHTGTQPASTISDFNASVRMNRLDQLTAPTGPVNMGGQLLTNLAAPSSGTDAATKTYVDGMAGGGGAVTSVDGRTGVVTLSDRYVDVSGDTMTGNLGLGQAGPSAKLHFANSTSAAGGIQFGDDLTLYRSAPEVLKTDGRLLINRNGQFDVPAERPLSVDGLYYVTSPSTAEYTGMYASTLIAGAANNNATAYGLWAQAGRWTGAGSLTTVTTIRADVKVNAGTVTNATGVSVNGPGDAATVTTSTGLSVGNMSGAGVTTSRGLYIAPQSNGTNCYGAVIDAAATRTLWVNANSTSTASSGGIFFGSNADVAFYRSAPGVLSSTGELAASTVTGSTFRSNSSTGPLWQSGPYSPEGITIAPIGSIFSRTNGAAGTAFYVKEVGTGNTGWTAFAVGGGGGVASVDSRTGAVTLSDLYVDVSGDNMTGNLGLGIAPTSKLHFAAATTVAGGIQFGADANLYRGAAGEIWSNATLQLGSVIGVAMQPGGRMSIANAIQANVMLGIGAQGIGNQFNSSGTCYGIQAWPQQNGTGMVVAGDFRAISSAGGTARAITANCRNTTGTVGQTVALWAAAPVNNGTITTAYGLWVDNQATPGNVTNARGLYIDQQTGANSTGVGLQVASSQTRTVWLSSEADKTTADAGIFFGASFDTNLYRSGPDTLQTDDAFRALTFRPAGLAPATANSRYVGATATGSPASGTFATGDWSVAQDGKIWICTSPGTPGLWTAAGPPTRTGWAAPTGTATRTAYATATATVTEVAERLKALIDDLTTSKLIGP